MPQFPTSPPPGPKPEPPAPPPSPVCLTCNGTKKAYRLGDRMEDPTDCPTCSPKVNENGYMEFRLTLFKPGSKVKIIHSGENSPVVGVIKSVQINADLSILYEVNWWNGRSLSTDDFYANELEAVEEQTISIGFKA